MQATQQHDLYIDTDGTVTWRDTNTDRMAAWPGHQDTGDLDTITISARLGH